MPRPFAFAALLAVGLLASGCPNSSPPTQPVATPPPAAPTAAAPAPATGAAVTITNREVAVRCGCEVQAVGHCSDLAELDGKMVHLVDHKLGDMPFCHKP